MDRTAIRHRGLRSELRQMASRGHWLLCRLEEFMDLANHLCTFVAFFAACLLVPGTIVLCTAVTGARRCWLELLHRRFPSLEFVKNVTVRTATDTMRNQGIITLLLTVKGSFEPKLIKERLQADILDRRNAKGHLMFPHLRTALTTRWGRYAWEKPSSFSLDNHLVVGSALFRGRIVNDWNIQECVSDTVSKYLPPELPPWQITIIPASIGQEERFYLLIRIHHLLLSEEGLGLGDLLLLAPEQPSIFNRRLDEDDENPTEETPLVGSTSPLTALLATPVALPKLYSLIRGFVKNRWSQLVATYDPVENPQILESQPGIQMCTILVFIIGVSIFKELLGLANQTEMSLYTKILSISPIVLTEMRKRHLTPHVLCTCVMNSLSPKQLLLSCLSVCWWMSYIFTVTVPVFLIDEMRSFVSMTVNRGLSECTTERSCSYLFLVLAAVKEAFCLCTIIYTAPRMLLQELVTSHRGAMHHLQTVSLCGRKVVAWSDAIPVDTISKISSSVGASTTAVLLSSVSGALREYFYQFCLPVPESVLTTARYFPLESLTKPSRGSDGSSKSLSGQGLVCLALPTSPVCDDPKESVQEIQRILSEVRLRQPALYQATVWQLDGGHITKILPSLAVRLVLNHLSRRYAVALTQVESAMSSTSRCRLIWGQEVEGVLYWRPPQSNISLSLTLMTYGDSVRLGVMSDSMIAPRHAIIATAFPQQVYRLATAMAVPHNHATVSSSTSHVYQPNIPPDEIFSAHRSNTPVSSASEELRHLTSSSPELNVSTSSDSSRSNSPLSSLISHTLKEENTYPFAD